jgi:hypothetical protein
MDRVKDFPFMLTVILLVYLIPQSALAYIDATAGSYALQGMLGAAFALMFYARGAWNWINRRGRTNSKSAERQ